MNFLAHIFLSGDNRSLAIGNFIADHIKGSALSGFPPGIQNGVHLHRKIDSFTDSHPVVSNSKKRLRPSFRKFAPVIADIYYDHFLAYHFQKFSNIPLEEFASDFYKLTREYAHIFPERTKTMLTYMVKGNWLVSYRSMQGIDNVLRGMAKRTSFDSGMEYAAIELEKNYSDYESEFFDFFKDLQSYTSIQPELTNLHSEIKTVVR